MTKRLRAEDPETSKDTDVCIVSYARTPIGNFLGSISTLSAPELGGIAIKAALEKVKLDPNLIEEVFMGNVISAGLGQNPARQASLKAGLPNTVPATTVNKVCSSGLKATMFGAQAIATGQRNIVVVGGMENMSLAPHCSNLRRGTKFGDMTFVDALQKDGLKDAYEDRPMGDYAELLAKEMGFSRGDQDAHALESYNRSRNAILHGKFKDEICSVDIVNRKSSISISQDEEPMVREVTAESLSKLRPAFDPNGSVTAGNASTLSDGGAALVLMSRKKAEELKIPVLFVIRGFDDAAHEPKYFTTAPTLSVQKLLKRTNYSTAEIDFYEINEAFSVVALANTKNLKLDPSKVNVYGGAVSIGHPLGCSAARILITLCSVLIQEGGRIGCATICNGGGGSSAMLIEKQLA